MTFGKSLAEARTQRGLTQTALAKEIGNKQPNIAAIEGDNRDPGLELLQELAGALDGEIIIGPDRNVRIRLI